MRKTTTVTPPIEPTTAATIVPVDGLEPEESDGAGLGAVVWAAETMSEFELDAAGTSEERGPLEGAEVEVVIRAADVEIEFDAVGEPEDGGGPLEEGLEGGWV